MHRLFGAASFAIASATGAFAADSFAHEGASGPVLASGHDWTGLYVGGAAGYSWIGVEDFSFPSVVDGGGVSGALYGGYNLQLDRVVIGVEGDLSINAASLDDGIYMVPFEHRLGGSLRGRVGFAVHRVLPYVTGGVARARFEIDHIGDGDPVDFADRTMSGYVLGAGVEWAATANIVLRAEYLHSDYGTETFDFYGGNDPHDISVRTNDLRFGIAYRF